MTMGSDNLVRETPVATDPGVMPLGVHLERRGRWWVFGSFILCPCHLPLTLAIASTVLAGTSLGAVIRDNSWAAGAIVTAVWLLGTGYGFRLLRRSQQSGGACAVPRTRRGAGPASRVGSD